MAEVWRNCSSCKSEIGLATDYYTCSVSTCNQKNTNYVFCSVACFERHLPGARHKDAWAEQNTAPRHAVPAAANNTPAPGQRRIIASKPSPVTSNVSVPMEVLVVVSKLKAYIKAKYDYNTSNDVIDKLTEMIRIECDKAADRARADGRKTVMGRDF